MREFTCTRLEACFVLLVINIFTRTLIGEFTCERLEVLANSFPRRARCRLGHFPHPLRSWFRRRQPKALHKAGGSGTARGRASSRICRPAQCASLPHFLWFSGPAF